MSSPPRQRILLVEDHALVREGVRRLLDDQPDCEIVAAAGDGIEAVRLCAETSPTIAIVDLSMPGVDGIKVLEMLRATCPEVRLIVLTRHDDPSFVARAVDAGAIGYVLKQSASTELLGAIRAVASGRQHIDASIDTALPVALPPRSVRSAHAGQSLSGVEEQMLRLFAVGCSNHEIAQRLDLQAEEVAVDRRAAMHKLGLATRVDVLRYATERDWL